MTRDTFILIAFCVFVFLAGMRMRQRWSEWRKKKTAEPPLAKNQRSKAAHADESPEVRSRRIRREKRVRFFTIVQLLVLGGLMIFMIPSLVRDLMLPGRVETVNLFLRCLIFVFTIYIFIIGYIKVFGRKNKDNPKE